MKNSSNFKIRLPAVFFAVILIVAVAAAYTVQLNKTVSDNISGTISELAEHDQSSIQNYIEETWTELEYISGKLVSEGCETIYDVESMMNVECSSSRFSHIYMVAEDGKIYTDKMLEYDPKSEGQNGRINLLPYLENGEEKIVTRFDDELLSAGLSRQCILYGIKLDGFSADGVKMKGLFGISDINSIQDRLVINSFSNGKTNRGYSAVVDMDGNFIANESNNVHFNDTDNFFQHISDCKKTELSCENIQKKMEKGETFSFSFTTEDNVKKIVYCMPFSNSNVSWYFLLSVEKNVFTEQNRTFLIMSMTMLVSILIVVVILIIYVMSSKNKVMAANAEAAARSRFLANMSHEIRTPLNGIIGLIYLIGKDIDRADKQQITKIRLLKAANTADYLLSLVNNVLDITKIQSGKIEINSNAVSPEIIADAVWSMQKSNIESRGVNFELKTDISEPWIIGDEILIKRVLMNIVSNAAKFTDPGGKITLSVSQQKDDADHVATFFCCEDTGRGMSEEFLTHIWDSFSQERHNNENSGGTGLGMTISKLITEEMGGDITVKSKLGEGSTFTVVLHSEIASAPVPAANISEEASSSPEEKRLKILLAEDNELNAEILTEILKGEGFKVVHAENGKTAVEKFENSPAGEFDIILMDMQMPVMDGCTATRTIRKLERADAQTVPIFACTANSFTEDRNRAIASGMNDFLSKPIDVNEMLTKISAIASPGSVGSVGE